MSRTRMFKCTNCIGYSRSTLPGGRGGVDPAPFRRRGIDGVEHRLHLQGFAQGRVGGLALANGRPERVGHQAVGILRVGGQRTLAAEVLALASPPDLVVCGESHSAVLSMELEHVAALVPGGGEEADDPDAAAVEAQEDRVSVLGGDVLHRAVACPALPSTGLAGGAYRLDSPAAT